MFVLDTQLTVDSGDYSLHLAHCEHTSEKRVAGIVAMALLVEDAARSVGERETMIHAHREIRILFLENAHELDQVCAAAEMGRLGKVAVREYVAAAEMDEMSPGSELLREIDHIVIGPCGERAGAEGQAVMLVRNGVEEPFDVLLGADDARKSEDLDRRIVRMHAHVHVAFVADRHDSFEEVFHVGAELCLVDAFVELEEVAELLDRSLVVLTEVA